MYHQQYIVVSLFQRMYLLYVALDKIQEQWERTKMRQVISASTACLPVPPVSLQAGSADQPGFRSAAL